MRSGLQPITFADVEGWRADDHAAALRVFRIGAQKRSQDLPPTESTPEYLALRSTAELAIATGEIGRTEARAFFERHFTPHRVEAEGFVTGYYEPEAEARLTESAAFSVPLYRRPADLVEVDPAPGAERRFARMTPDGPTPYFDRAAIEGGALAGRQLELAWLRDPVEAFFIHVQGSARLRLPRQAAMRICFDGKSGHPYTSIGRLAVERGLLRREAADKDGLEAFLRRHPAEGLRLMRENRSFIFFRQTRQPEDEGPIGAAGVPLTPLRSLAVDRNHTPFHAPVWVAPEGLADPERSGQPFRRLLIAHDVGSAILGPARGDIFFGSGPAAGALAGRVRHAAAMTALLPNPRRG